MRKRRLLTSLLAALALSAVVPIVAQAGGETSGGGGSTLGMLLEDELGLDPDQAAEFEGVLNPVGTNYWSFGWGGNAEVPATISLDEVPWAVPEAIGLNYIWWQDPDRFPDFTTPVAEVDGVVRGGVNGGPELGTTYAVMTAVMAEDIRFGEGPVENLLGGGMLLQQWDFGLQMSWLEPWEAHEQFPDDTWNWVTFVMSLKYGPEPWGVNYYGFNNGNIETLPLSGFVLGQDNILIIGVEADPMYFGTGTQMYDIGGRLALDIKDAPFNPERSLVLTAPMGPLTQDSFLRYPGIHTHVPGLPGQIDPMDVWAIADGEGDLWFNVKLREPWDGMAPMDWWSHFVQIGCKTDATSEFPDRYVGHEVHKTTAQVFGQSQTGEIRGLMGFVLSDGSLLFSGPCEWDGESSFSIVADGGFQPTPDGRFQWVSRPFDFTASDVVFDANPREHDGLQVVYDMVTQEKFEIVTPEPTPIVTEEDVPVAVVTSEGGECCWWCWGIVLLFAVVLLGILFLWLRSYEWFSCWLAWFLVIFMWVPFLLAGLWWWRPDWWWVPLLAWFPLVGGYTWYWAQKQAWWKPWHLYVSGGYLGLLAGGMWRVGAPEWGLLLPLFWVPLVAFYLWGRGMRRPWFRPWMWGLAVAYVAWVFVWVEALTPWWAWWLPLVFVAVGGWWFQSNDYAVKDLYGPKWSWVVPFALLPFLAWWIPMWGPWWCFVIALFLAKTLILMICNHCKDEEWWSCWTLWAIVLFGWVPLLTAGLWFFRPNWWAWTLLPVFALVPAYAYLWGQKRSWWQDWMWYAVGGYLAFAAAAMYVVGDPEWGLLLGVFWLPWVAGYVWYRGMRQPWWQPWFLGLIGLYGLAFVYWFESDSLTPYWGAAYPIVLAAFLGWWYLARGYDWRLGLRKGCFVVPFALLPWLGYMTAVYCVPAYYYGRAVIG